MKRLVDVSQLESWSMKLSMLRIFIDGNKYKGGIQTLNDIIADIDQKANPREEKQVR
jgi:hypothetical protein